jgi:hypothetical protein
MPAPIVLFVYNRLVHTRQTLEALAANSLACESDLWIFSDGPKCPEVARQVEEVRQYIHYFKGTGRFASVKIKEMAQNKGLAGSVIDGVTNILNVCKSVIVLEDDLVTAPDFLTFMNACLDYYNGHPGVGSISGYSPLRTLPRCYRDDVYLVPRSCSWGWATWRDRWHRVDWKVADFDEFRKDRSARRQFNQCGSDRYDRLQRQVDSDINSWSIRFGYWQFRQGMCTVYPAVSRVRNIGTDGSGTHNSCGARYNDELSGSTVPFVLSAPAQSKQIVLQFKREYSGSFLSRVSRFLRNNGFGFVYVVLRKLIKQGDGC